MEAVVRQPHAEPERHQGVGVARRHLQGAGLEPAPPATQRGRAADGEQRQRDQGEQVERGRRQQGRANAHERREPLLPLHHRADHARRVGEGAEHQHHDQGRQVGAAAEAADAGALAVVPQLRRGEAGDQADVVVRAGVDAIEAERCSPCCPPCAAGTGAARSRGCRRGRGCSPSSGTTRRRPGRAP